MGYSPLALFRWHLLGRPPPTATDWPVPSAYGRPDIDRPAGDGLPGTLQSGRSTDPRSMEATTFDPRRNGRAGAGARRRCRIRGSHLSGAPHSSSNARELPGVGRCLAGCSTSSHPQLKAPTDSGPATIMAPCIRPPARPWVAAVLLAGGHWPSTLGWQVFGPQVGRDHSCALAAATSALLRASSSTVGHRVGCLLAWAAFASAFAADPVAAWLGTRSPLDSLPSRLWRACV